MYIEMKLCRNDGTVVYQATTPQPEIGTPFEVYFGPGLDNCPVEAGHLLLGWTLTPDGEPVPTEKSPA